MTRCQAFYQAVKSALENHDLSRLEKLCKAEATKLFRVKKYIQFCDSYGLEYGLVSEKALQPVISLGDPDIAVKLLEELKPMLKSKKSEVTSETVKKVLAGLEGQVYLTTAERKEIGSETHLKQVEACCNEFLAMDVGERAALLRDLRRVDDLLRSWCARVDGSNLRDKIDDARKEIDSLRNELLMFLPGSVDPRKDGHSL